MRHLALSLAFALLAGSAALADGAAGDLRLTIRVEPAEVDSGKPVRIVATFTNAGRAPLKFFEPEDAHGEPFPQWRFARADGTVWAPTPFQGQSMWTEGIQGAVRTIAPGASIAFEHEARAWAPVDAAGTLDPEHSTDFLPAGSYEVRAEHAHADATVPFGLDDFKTRREPVDGLWTGSVRAEPVRLEVRPTKEPRVVFHAPDEVAAGEPFPVRVRFENPSTEPLTLRGALVLYAHSKMYGGGFAFFRVAERPEPVAPGEVAELRLAAGESREVALDLSALSYSQSMKEPKAVGGLYEKIPEGIFFAQATFQDAAGRNLLRADGTMLRIRRTSAKPPAGLRLLLRAKEDTNVEVALRNDGATAVRVPKRLAYPSDVYLAVTDPTGKRPPVRSMTMTATTSFEEMERLEPGDAGVVPDGASWDGDRFEKPASLVKDDLVLLEPGRELVRTLDVGALVLDLGAGSFEVRAFWRNAESGRRLGVADDVARGLLRSDPVTIRSAAR